ncbi:MAG: hypothetical protein SRB2_04435 [Desulfobacteraceae bacterium Eth-SRB2]|nr:MAG: hypothetical protein SRB2_04435 [Desulfobacteraceae bacterium Eth-SRB2]
MKKVKNELGNNLRYICLIVVIAFGLIGIVGSGGGGGGNSEYLSTVSLTAQYAEGYYEADVTVKVDTSDPADDICDIYTFFADEVNVTITSTSKEDLPEGVTANPVQIMSYTVEYIALEDSPAVPTKQFNYQQTIDPDHSAVIPIRVIDQEDKIISSSPLNYIDYFNSGAASYEYTVRVTLRAEEVLSGEGTNLKVEFTLYYLDIADECY